MNEILGKQELISITRGRWSDLNPKTSPSLSIKTSDGFPNHVTELRYAVLKLIKIMRHATNLF